MGWLHNDDHTAESLSGRLKTVTKVLSGEGKELGPNDGFIVQGCIFVSEVGPNGPQGGLIGSGKIADILDKENVPLEVFDKKTFLRALGYKSGELREIADWMASPM